MPCSPVIELEQISKAFETTRALERVDLRVEPGQTTVLIGPSGCGKSTLLRVLVGLIEPDGGTATFEGSAITPRSVHALRRRMGYVIQEGGLFPHLTATENVVLMARELGWPEPKWRSRLGALAELTRLPTDALDRYPVELSGGQRQRVSLMRALMLDPDVLLMDEPLGALDSMIRFELQVELRAIFRRLGKTVLLVTHDLDEAGFFGDVIVLLRKGRIEQRGTLEELVHDPRNEFVRAFVNAQRSALAPLREKSR
ncbi:MAG: ATP-binding cassette domain-containing protein [Myxococcales bacterium]|nr:ATP-binding cassette domain-containing protein [Myxococcales bacterium]MDH3482876.1 ATP-binding cassette domain-containing protein [Myxococcales bacterium]